MGTRKDIRFGDPTLNNAIFRKNAEFIVDEFEGLENVSYELTIKDKVPEIIENEEVYENSSLVIFNLKVGGSETKYPFYIEIEYQSIFEWDDDSGFEKDEFLSVNAPAILYSYCRPVINNLTSISEFPPFNLPFYNFTKKTFKKD